MKKALILGTGAAQLDAIRYLKREGWWVIACSYVREGPGLDFTDQFELINITDVDALERVAKSENIELIYSVGSDLAMPSVAEVAVRIGLRSFISPHIARLLQDKTLLRDFLATHGISPIRYRRVRTHADVEGWSTFPVMVKPADSQGQRGIFRAESLPEIMNRLGETIAVSRSGTVILEEVLEGPEVSANIFVVEGKVVVNEISDRSVVANFPGGIPRGHVLPSGMASAEVLSKTRKLVDQCIAVLGIKEGPVYFQMKLTSSGPRIIEITPRLDGCHIWRLIREVRGIDLMDASFRLLSGEALGDLGGTQQLETGSLMFFLQPPGEKFFEANHPAPDDALHTEYYLRNGQVVPTVNGHLEKVGYYITKRMP